MYRVHLIEATFNNNLEYDKAALLACTTMKRSGSIALDEDRRSVAIRYPLEYPNVVLSYITAIRDFNFDLKAFDDYGRLIETVELDGQDFAVDFKKYEVSNLFDYPTSQRVGNVTVFPADKSGLITYLSYKSSTTKRWEEAIQLEFDNPDESKGFSDFHTAKNILHISIPRQHFDYEYGKLTITITKPFSIMRELIGVLLRLDCPNCTIRLYIDGAERCYLSVSKRSKSELDTAIGRAVEILRDFNCPDTPVYTEFMDELVIPANRAGLLAYFVFHVMEM